MRSAEAALALQKSLTTQRHGIAFAVATSLLFACSDALIKQLVVLAPFVLVIWLRYVFQLGLMSAWLLVTRSRSLQVDHWRLHLLRCSLLAVSSFSGYLALRHIPLAEYTALMMLAPVVSVLLGRVVLKSTCLRCSGCAFYSEPLVWLQFCDPGFPPGLRRLCYPWPARAPMPLFK